MTVELERGVPILRIFDVDRARQFYVDWLGFTVDFEHPFDDTGPRYIGISRDGLRLHLSEHSGDGTPGTAVYVTARGVRELHEEISAKLDDYLNPGLAMGPVDGESLCLLDPFGNTLRIEERLDDATS